MQFAIEQRQLTSEDSHRPAFEPESTMSIVEAANHDEAIGRFAAARRSRPCGGTKRSFFGGFRRARCRDRFVTTA
jgi:hypothetical protein